jgi:hypothetical protein
MLMAGGSLVAGSDKPHFGTSMPLGPSTPSFLFLSAAQADLARRTFAVTRKLAALARRRDAG